MKSSLVLTMTGLLLIAGMASAQYCVQPAVAPCVQPVTATCGQTVVTKVPAGPTVLTTGYQLTTRPATPVLVAIPVAAAPCATVVEAPAEEPAPVEVAAPVEEAPVAVETACAPCGAPAVVAYTPRLKRQMVCTRPVSVASTDVRTGRPYTVTRRVACRPRSIYHVD